MPLAVVLSVWWMYRLNPCLDDDLVSRVHGWLPREPETAAIPSGPDAVVIENPYGIQACDHWPSVTDHWITLITLLLVSGLVGFFAARFEHRPVRKAALVMAGAMIPAVLLSYLVYLPDMLQYAQYRGYAQAMIEMSAGLGIAFVAGALAALAAWLRVRQPR
jgi:hypothetical protein